MTRGRLAAGAVTVGAVAITLAALLSSRGGRSEPPRVAPLPVIETVVLVTIDTLRADRVGAYGWAAARTPVIDALAARGVRFRHAFATAPITLPSHASLLTGLYPPGHGSRHNGLHLRAGSATLATILHDQGWSTGAFVGAFPLDRRFGLDRGFDVYGDRMPRGSDGRLRSERPGVLVVDEALEWARGLGDRRGFLWVHLFEPHAPYEPDAARGPEGRTLPAAARYDDEVARTDAAIGRLLTGLGGRIPSALIVVAADHGEAFGEHGEIAHSVFLYDTTLRVPLVIAGPGIGPAGAAPGAAVSLVDVLPTVMDALGLPQHDVDGVSLLPVLRGGEIGPRDLYAETFAPLLDFGWSSLRSIRSGNWKYIAAPSPELYDVSADPDEAQDRSRDDEPRVRDLARRVEKYSGSELPAAASAETPLDAESRRRLGALGYVSAGPAAAGPRPDPKDRRDLAARLAQVVTGELQGVSLRAALEAILQEDPRNGQAQMRLGYVLVEGGDLRGAERQFRAAIEASMPTADVHLGLALCFASTGRPEAATRALLEARRLEPGNPVVDANIGSLALDAGNLPQAIEYLGSALRIDPDLHQARFNLARALARLGRRADALAEARALLNRLPAQAPQRPEVQRLIDALR